MAKNYRQGTITFIVGSYSLVLTFDGGFKWTGGGVDVSFVKDRGELPDTPEVVLGEEKEINLAFEAIVTGGQPMTSASALAMGDFLLAEFGSGYLNSVAPLGTLGAGALAHLIDISFSDGTNTYLFEDCRLTGEYENGTDGNKLTFAAVCPHPYPTVS